jgi:hydroxyacyl-ACP dehydratase HTD2-like protein with hotdog domain
LVTTYQDYLGRTETRGDTVWPLLVRGLAATLDVADPGADPGGVLPPLWHWLLFQDWAPASGLGPDGHPRRGGFLPPVHHLPRRMWAGGRVSFAAPLRVGETVTRSSTIQSIEQKAGASGTLVFVTVRHEIAGAGGVAIREEQDIVYRGTAGAAVRPAAAAAPPPAGAVARTLTPDAVLLFRYSALTGNGHRIHYDLDYVTRTEGYPGLVVHGPLQATLLAALAVQSAPGRALRQFAYRGRRPAFHDRPLTLLATPLATLGDGVVTVESRDDTGAVCMEGEARLG